MCERNGEGCSSGCCSECDFDEWLDYKLDSSDDEEMETLETSAVTDATDARDKSKIKRKYKNGNGNKNHKNDDYADDYVDDYADDYADNELLSELNPSYIESEISNTVLARDIMQEELYESMLDNGLSIKKHKMTNIKYPFADKSSEHLTQDIDVIDDYEEILVEFFFPFLTEGLASGPNVTVCLPAFLHCKITASQNYCIAKLPLAEILT